MAFSERARPWHARGHSSARGGLLLCHGFTGTPQPLRPWGEELAEREWEVSLPLLPGHGSTWQQMARTTAAHWYAAVREAALELLGRHRTIAVGGLSMGGTLALALAQDPAIAGRLHALVAVNPAATAPAAAAAAGVVWPLVRSVAGIASDIRARGGPEEAYSRAPVRSVAQLRVLTGRVRRRLARVRTPLLLATSPRDHVVPPRDSDLIAAGVSGPVERLRLAGSYHVATLDHDAELLATTSGRFIEEHRG